MMDLINETEIPQWCDFYKFLLVEELTLCNDITLLHSGYCSIIGRVVQENDKFYLESLKITAMKPVDRLPDGDTKILLLKTVYEKCPPINSYVECFGEVVLWRKQSESITENPLPMNSQILLTQLRNKQLEMSHELSSTTPSLDSPTYTERDQLNSDIFAKYEPAIQLHSLNTVDQPHELISSNLYIRLICLRKKRL